VSLTPINQVDLCQLEKQWLQLESSANNSIFTSWLWISTWLNFINKKTQLLKVTFQDIPVGLGFLTENIQIKNGFRSRQLWLNRTGDTSLDQIWNEYNDILCQEGVEHSIRAALLEYFNDELTDFDELVVGVSNQNITQTPRPKRIMQHTSWSTNSYVTLLKPEFDNLNNFLQTLSANTRRQIKRTINLYQEQSSIKITKAATIDQALAYFSAAGELHKKRWGQQTSGFGNSNFLRFHQQLINTQFESGVIDIIKIHNDEHTISYLYNFHYKGKAYFYLSGINYQSDNRLKPGLLSHSLVISDYAAEGISAYDFMGGDGRYKKSLSNSSDTMVISNFRRKNLPFLLSHNLRRMKSAIA
jgi:CelD/BcsL family acetyltransferase involved in cellulose biosynthesis